MLCKFVGYLISGLAQQPVFSYYKFIWVLVDLTYFPMILFAPILYEYIQIDKLMEIGLYLYECESYWEYYPKIIPK